MSTSCWWMPVRHQPFDESLTGLEGLAWAKVIAELGHGVCFTIGSALFQPRPRGSKSSTLLTAGAPFADALIDCRACRCRSSFEGITMRPGSCGGMSCVQLCCSILRCVLARIMTTCFERVHTVMLRSTARLDWFITANIVQACRPIMAINGTTTLICMCASSTPSARDASLRGSVTRILDALAALDYLWRDASRADHFWCVVRLCGARGAQFIDRYRLARLLLQNLAAPAAN